MTSRSPLPLALALLPLSHPALDAQVPREVLLEEWERQKAVVLAYAEAMPEDRLGYRPTPGVRTFAQQIEHIVEDNVRIVATGVVGDGDPPPLGDPALYLSDREALRAMVERGYGYVLDAVTSLGEDELAEEGEVFGRYRVPRWRALEKAREHALWTLGQTVPYLRLSGVEPPPYQVFPEGTRIPGR